MADSVRVVATKALRGFRKYLATWINGGLAREEYVYDVPPEEAAKAVELGGVIQHEGNYGNGSTGDA